MKLSNKIALLTGSTSGIGAAAARALAGEGAHVIVVGRDEARGRSVLESIRAEGGTADFIAAVLHDESSARMLATSALQIAGRLTSSSTTRRSACSARPLQRRRNS